MEYIINNNNNKKLETYEENEFAKINQKEDNEFNIIPNKITEFTSPFTAIACQTPHILSTSIKKIIVISPIYFQNSSTIFCPNCNNNKHNDELLLLILYKVPICFAGGSGKYRLEINNTSIASIINHNTIINGNDLGHTYLFIIDYFNPDNFAYIHIEIERIKIWKLQQNVIKEILINNFVSIPILISDKYNRQFSSLNGMKQVIHTSSINNHVSLEFIAPTIDQIIKQRLNINNNNDIQNNNNNNNTQIIKNVIKSEFKPIINCTEMIGQISVRAFINEGYDEFTISLKNIRVSILHGDYIRYAFPHLLLVVSVGKI